MTDPTNGPNGANGPPKPPGQRPLPSLESILGARLGDKPLGDKPITVEPSSTGLRRASAPRLQGCWPGFWIGLAGAALTSLLFMLVVPGFTMADLQSKLQRQAQAALAAQGFDWARVEMDGQRATLSGAAPSQVAKDRAFGVVLASSGPGGDYAGGVTRVVNDIIVGAPISPYTWSARRTAAGVRLSGHVPSESIKAALLQRARQIFNANPEDALRISPGAPAGDWQRVATAGIESVAKLRRGEARLVDGRLIIIGEGPQASVDELRARSSMGVTPGFEVRLDVTVEGQGLAAPELAGIDLNNATPEICTAAFGRLMQTSVINFALNSDAIEASSEALLNNLISVAVRCDSARIEVSGHTDSSGDQAANFELSQRRANSVRRYLVERGVLEDRIVAQGFGATRPVATNATIQGQAQNRRIEFKVVSP